MLTVNPKPIMNIIIHRYRHKIACTEQGRSETLDGELYIDGLKICDTAENANGALPEGTYPITLLKCKQYKRKMLLLNPHPPCSKCPPMDYCGNNSTLPCYCPMLKAGNGVYKRLDGSIILGTYICPGCLKLPKQAFDSVYDRLRKSAERGHQITLTIKNSFKQ